MARGNAESARLCDPFVDGLPVTGAAISTFSGTVMQVTLCASDPVAARVDELQFDLGEGPCRQALVTHEPVHIPDVAADGHVLWPIFGAAIQDTPAVAVFAFPLFVGALNIGAVDLYRTTAGPLDNESVLEATRLSKVATWDVLAQLARASGSAPGDVEDLMGSRREVHQAAGMILVQLGITLDSAYLLLRAHAYSSGRTVVQLARDVIEFRLDFSDLQD